MLTYRHCLLGSLLVILTSVTWGFNGQRVVEGPLTLTIEPVARVMEYDQPQTVTVTVANQGSESLLVTLKLAGLVDQWRPVGVTEKQVTAPGGQSGQATFQIAAGPGAYSALYPVHIYATFTSQGRTVTAHAVQIFDTLFTTTATTAPAVQPVTSIPAQGATPLQSLRTQQVGWAYFDKPAVLMPVGWSGSAPDSRASFAVRQMVRGTSRPAIEMHPAWYGGAGTVWVDYKLQLPDAKPIKLAFANAIRDSSPTEPASDGVTFRVWIGDEKLFERHTDSKVWVPGQADLSRFAGREIILRLESHPGPKKNTTCDASYWGQPVIVSGPALPQLSAQEREALRNTVRKSLGTPPTTGQQIYRFELENGNRAALALGQNGLMDGALALGQADTSVVYDGLNLEIMGDTTGREYSPVTVLHVTPNRQGNRVIVTHRLSRAGKEFDLTATLWAEKGGLRLKVECPERITTLALNPADHSAGRVYYGHGYCIENPKPFQAHYGGHNLSTSHVGFEFDSGLALLMAVDNPPDYLEVVPQEKVYTLHTHENATLTLVPGVAGIYDCAKRYRSLYDKQAAPGVARKAGRFVFDVWGGRYADIARTMQQLIDYGLTDSMLTLHVWQRWGYDYRLPDIFPPDPGMGTIEDMNKIGAVCNLLNIPWGLHDNYIDFYPDAEDYSYQQIAFTEAGEPIRAWLNEGREAQSYRWRPDRIMPAVQRNLALIKPALAPSHYFIDVFTSIDCFNFYDYQGQYHSMLETRKHWGEAFAWIKQYLGNNAITTSEAGDDLLVGYLDGADCQQLQLAPDSRDFCIRLECDDWERTPWFDAVLHDKFSLHGVGYPGRYEGGRSREFHGIESDDYISAELLSGHALMIDRSGFVGPGAVRKYWLAQDFVRSIANAALTGVQFAGDDIHRQIVRWSPDAVVYVNRGETDWQVAGKVLPQYGYYAKNGAIESSIEKIDGIIVERSTGPDRWYVNARGLGPENGLQLKPTAKKVEYLGGREFKLTIDWDVQQPAKQDLSIFLHFTSDQSDRSDKIAFQGDMNPRTGISQWPKGLASTGSDRILSIPSNLGPGEYGIGIGLWDPATGRRYQMQGDDDGSTRYLLGKLVVEGNGTEISGIKLIPHTPKSQPISRWNPAHQTVDFGPIETLGGFRCQRDGQSLIVTPLPRSAPFDINLQLESLTGQSNRRIKAVSVIDAAGKTLGQLDYHQQAGQLSLTTRAGDFAYRIDLE